MKKIAVIGGGASGLVAAIAAARSNQKVQITIYEQKDSVGKKILATGNGRCNLTNKDMKSSYYRSENIPFVEEFRSGIYRSGIIKTGTSPAWHQNSYRCSGNGYYPDIVRLYDKAKYRKTESGCCNSGLWWKGQFKTGI